MDASRNQSCEYVNQDGAWSVENAGIFLEGLSYLNGSTTVSDNSVTDL